jgi:hypothetical protein
MQCIGPSVRSTHSRFTSRVINPAQDLSREVQSFEMMNDQSNKREFWYLSLAPFITAIAYYVALQAGHAPSLPTGYTIDLHPFDAIPWFFTTSQAFQQNGAALVMVAVATCVGVLLFTWVGIMVIDAKRAAYTWYENYRLEQQGAVSGMLRPTPRPSWSSSHVAHEEPKPYRSRFSQWIRHAFEDDHTSGKLRKD